MLVRGTCDRPAVVISDRQTERFKPPGDGEPDAAHPENADAPAPERRLAERIGTFADPSAGTQPRLSPGKLPDCIEQETDSGIGDFFSQHVRRVRHHHIANTGVTGVHRVITDTEIGNELQLRQRIDERGGNVSHGRNPANALGDIDGYEGWIGFVEAHELELICDPADRMFVQSSGNKHRDPLQVAHDTITHSSPRSFSSDRQPGPQPDSNGPRTIHHANET